MDKNSNKFIIVIVAIILSILAGIAIYTFIYAKGYSYLSNNPEVCTNCHIMRDEYNGWIKSSHHTAAVCNDCHVPHNIIGKYKTKAEHGFWHSFYFTTGWYPDNIHANQTSKNVVEENCRRCHGDMVHQVDGVHGDQDKLSCIRCHSAVGH